MTKHMIALAAAAIALQGCAQQQALPPGQAEDTSGVAKTCTASTPTTTNPATATIAMTNDGWCGVHIADHNAPFQYGLVKARPEHGYVIVKKVGNQTRVEYTADNRYVGPDKFTVALKSTAAGTPDTTLQVTVSVAMGESVAPAPAARNEPATPTRAPARKPATRR